MSTKWRTIVVVIHILLTAAILAACSSTSTSRNTTPGETGWAPAGFTAFSGDHNVAFEWVDQPTCTYSNSSCWAMTVVTRQGCANSLYGEVSLEDGGGTAIGYANDVAGVVQPGQRVLLQFDSFEKGATKARITKLQCY